jgi:hypothetical protein
MVLCLLCSLQFMSSCKEEDNLEKAPRMFRPLVETDVPDYDNWIKATWTKMADATSFTIQLSTDSFHTIYRDTTVTDAYFTFTNLDWDMVYQIRVRSNGATSGDTSAYYVCPNATIKYPTKLKDLTVGDIIDNGVRPNWNSDAANVFTKIKILTLTDSLVREVDLTATDLMKGYKEIFGLKQLTNYKVHLYAGDKYCGRKLFKTVASQVFSRTVDIRDTSATVAATMITTAWIASLADSSTVILKPAMKYKITGQTYFAKSITFISGLGFGDPATFSLSSNFNVTAGAAIANVKFSGVNLIGINPAAGFSGNFGGYYVFNFNTASSIQNLILDGCSVKYLRGVFRTQTSGSNTKNFIINNCIMDSIGGYGVANVDNVGASIENITVTNSTISNAQYFLRSTRNPTTTTKTITLANCTFFQVPQSPNYLLDISGTTTITNGAFVTNCIFSQGIASTATPTTYSIAGYRAANILSFSNSGNFKTSDLTWTTGTDIPDVASYTGTYTTLYTNPLGGNFTIKDKTFLGAKIAGDPRWRIK